MFLKNGWYAAATSGEIEQGPVGPHFIKRACIIERLIAGEELGRRRQAG
jgi:hypothetical protein